MYDHVFAEKIASLHSQQSPEEEENEHLKKTVRTLQAQLSQERRKRATLEQELGLVLAENGELERQLGAAGGFRARALELEAEVAEMRRALRSERPAAHGAERLGPGQSLLEELLLTAPEAPARPLQRSSSDTALGGSAAGDAVRGHEETCVRRAKAVRPRGVCLLREVDTQYSALRVRYDELLRRCQPHEDARSHKAVQTSRAPRGDPAAASAPGSPEPAGSPSSTPPPEYKALFQEIFSCIERTKQEIDAQRSQHRAAPAHS